MTSLPSGTATSVSPQIDTTVSPVSRWAAWLAHFDENAKRPLPEVADAAGVPAGAVEPLRHSLALFQLGESGEGRTANEIRSRAYPGTDSTFQTVVARFIAEEGRHARVLSRVVTGMGGTLVRWSAASWLFTVGRRLLGMQWKMVALLTAECGGKAYYGTVASRLGDGPVRSALQQIEADETQHLRFHACFFGVGIRAIWRRVFFGLAFGLMSFAAVVVLALNHGRALRAIGASRTGIAWRYLREAWSAMVLIHHCRHGGWYDPHPAGA